MNGKWIRRAKGESAVVFIHGILSDSETWRHSNGTYWPELLAEDADAANFGIYVFEYFTGFLTGRYGLTDIVDSLVNHMRLDKVLDCKQIIFVCHSMGGIVARRFVVRQYADLLAGQKKIGLFLIASPTLGSKYADWLSILAAAFKNSQALALRTGESNDWLRDLDKDFFAIKEQRKLTICGRELIETEFVVQKLSLMEPVVDAVSGGRNFIATKIPGTNHSTISKVADGQTIQYRLLVELLGEFRLETPQDLSLTNNDLRFLLAMEDGENRLPEHFQEIADKKFGYKFEHYRPEPRPEERLSRLRTQGLVERVGGSEFRITHHGQHVVRGIRQNPGSYASVFAAKRRPRRPSDKKRKSIEPDDGPTSLHYESSFLIRESCIPELLRSGIAKFQYSDELQDKIISLDAIIRDPHSHLQQMPRNLKQGRPESRGKSLTSHLVHFTDLQRELGDRLSGNEKALANLLPYIKEARAEPEHAITSITTLASLAALRVIFSLKKGFDWKDGKLQPWLEHYTFASGAAFPHFDLVPITSAIGRIAFHRRYWVRVRAGTASKYEIVTMPLREVLPIFKGEKSGDQDLFWKWVLPQLVFYSFYPLAEFPVKEWQATVLIGQDGEEWWSPDQISPWRAIEQIEAAEW